jgi:hypothetical protein
MICSMNKKRAQGLYKYRGKILTLKILPNGLNFIFGIHLVKKSLNHWLHCFSAKQSVHSWYMTALRRKHLKPLRVGSRRSQIMWIPESSLCFWAINVICLTVKLRTTKPWSMLEAETLAF